LDGRNSAGFVKSRFNQMFGAPMTMPVSNSTQAGSRKPQKNYMQYLFLISSVFILACQDHHFVPIEKAEKITLPDAAKQGEQNPGKLMESALEKMRHKGESEPASAVGPVQLIVEGMLDLGPEQKKKDFTGFTIYVIAWPQDGKRAPIAVARYTASKFPMQFKLDTNDLMMSEPPAPGSGVLIEARLDKESDPSAKSPEDVAGESHGPIAVGASGINIIIDHTRNQ
jgi:hypothetical protein